MTRLKPRQSSYENALESFSSGDFRTCIESLSESTVPESVILRSRALIRVGDAIGAIDNLGAFELFEDSHELAAEALAVKSYALHVLKRPAEAALVGVEARARCFSSGLAGIEAELLFASAIGHVLGGDFESADAVAVSILDIVDSSPSWVKSKTYAYSLNFWRARACDLRGIVANVRTDYAAYAAWTRQAFDEYDESGVHDDYTHVAILANYADAAISLGLDDIVDFVLSRAESIAWNANLVAHEFRVFSALAEVASASGDQLGALRHFRRCLDCAPSAALQIRAGVERARLLHEIGESFSAREEIDHAVRLSRSINWEEANPMDQRQLILLAGQVAKYDGLQAASLLARYDGLSSKCEIGVAIKDERFRGEEFMARAAVQVASGQRDRAVMLFIDALETFTTAKLEMRAGYAAAELATITNESHYVEIARKQSKRRPQSILALKTAQFEGMKPSEQIASSTVVKFARPKLALLS